MFVCIVEKSLPSSNGENVWDVEKSEYIDPAHKL